MHLSRCIDAETRYGTDSFVLRSNFEGWIKTDPSPPRRSPALSVPSRQKISNLFVLAKLIIGGTLSVLSGVVKVQIAYLSAVSCGGICYSDSYDPPLFGAND